MPCGTRPSMAALTRSGARKASEIVMLIFRALQFSRLAMLSALAVGSAMSSPSQQRPRAIATTNRARVSERIGRACSGRIPSGRRISRRKSAWRLGKMDDQPVWLDLDVGDVSMDEAAVISGL